MPLGAFSDGIHGRDMEMAMDITFGGKFENALIRAVTVQNNSDRLGTSHPYYRSLHRYVPRSYFDRCSTFIVVATQVDVTAIDWRFKQGLLADQIGITEQQFGVEYADGRLQDRLASGDFEIFAAILLTRGAFSAEVLRSLTTVAGPLEVPPVDRDHRVETVGIVEWYAHHQLMRLLEQIHWTQQSSSRLVLGDEEIAIVQEMCAFVASTRMPAPISLPDLSAWNPINAESFAGGLLNFSPPDALAAAAVRANSEIQSYAAKVRDILSESSSLENKRKLLHAMREALEKDELAQRVQNVFETVSWIAKPLHYIPGVDAMMSVGEDALEIGKKWIDRKKGAEDWFLLGPKMADISLRDYLNRTGNL